MKLTRESLLTGKTNTMELPISEREYKDWQDGEEFAAIMFPHLSEDEIRFLTLGATPEETAALAADVAQEEIEVESANCTYA